MITIPDDAFEIICAYLRNSDRRSCTRVSKGINAASRYSIDPTEDNNHPIRYHAANGNLLEVEQLLSYPSVDPTTSDNEAIRLAARNGHADVVSALAPRVNIKVLQEILCTTDSSLVVEVLLTNPLLDPNGIPLRSAILRGDRATVKLLLDSGRIDVASAYNVAVMTSSFRRAATDPTIILDLVDYGFKADIYKMSHPIIDGWSDVVIGLLDRGALENDSSNVSILLNSASIYGRIGVVEYILRNFVIDELMAIQPVIQAVDNGNTELLNVILASGLDHDVLIGNMIYRGLENVVGVLLSSPNFLGSVDFNREIKLVKKRGFRELAKVLISHRDKR